MPSTRRQVGPRRSTLRESSIPAWASSTTGKAEAPARTYCVPGQTNPGDHYIKRIHVHMPDGSSHELRLDDQAYTFPVAAFTGTFYAVDGSRMRFESNAGAASVLYLPDGARYIFPAYNIGNDRHAAC